MPIWSPGRHTPTQKIPKCPPPRLHGGTLPFITGFCVSLPIKKSCPILVCYTAVFSVVTQFSSPQRCVTTLKTAVRQTSPILLLLISGLLNWRGYQSLNYWVYTYRTISSGIHMSQVLSAKRVNGSTILGSVEQPIFPGTLVLQLTYH